MLLSESAGGGQAHPWLELPGEDHLSQRPVQPDAGFLLRKPGRQWKFIKMGSARHTPPINKWPNKKINSGSVPQAAFCVTYRAMKIVKTYFALLFLSLLALIVIATDDAAAQELKAAPVDDPAYIAEDPRLARLVGSPGPMLSLQTIDGGRIDLKDIYGKKPIYLKLWATYCIPCRVQTPRFEKIFETFGDRIQVIAVNGGMDDDIDKIRAFVRKAGMRMPAAIDDGSLGAWLKMQEMPLHLLMGRDGRIAYAGHQDGPKLDAAINMVLTSSPSTAPIAVTEVENVVSLNPGDVVPDIELRSESNQPVHIQAGATSRPRAVLFTATWCESYLKKMEPESAEVCRRIRESVDKLAQAGDVEWLGVVTHMWTTLKDLADYQAKVKPQAPLAVDTNGMAFRVFGIRRFPAIALIGADGRLIRILGPDDTDLAVAVGRLAEGK
jgi:thiol-disulfide isomerase/thioredoxin